MRFDEQRERIREAAQPLDGPFVTQLRNATQGRQVTVVAGIHETNSDDRPFNTLVVLRNGELVTVYRKTHLYDAFGSLESDRVAAADDPPVVFTCAGTTVGLITCYDLRFPEMTRLLASMGTQVLVAAAAWAAGRSSSTIGRPSYVPGHSTRPRMWPRPVNVVNAARKTR